MTEEDFEGLHRAHAGVNEVTAESVSITQWLIKKAEGDIMAICICKL